MLGLFFDRLNSLGVFTIRHRQTSGRLVQELNEVGLLGVFKKIFGFTSACKIPSSLNAYMFDDGD